MNTRNLTPEERFELIMECRTSGLTDYQWLEEHGIRKSTFYNWITQFRKKGYPNIPEPLHQHSSHKAQQQEVVKVNVLPDLDRNTPSPSVGICNDPVMEIISGRTVIRLSNGTDPRLLETVLRSLGGTL
ncbi:MAG: transposase [Paenibacillus sp.]|uniref:IS66 family insertion sequence element accessory protein TnpA n=1 Tax=Paenibacillus sp. TaxID=58172 RepID=UPI0025F51BDC|nr:transposase [Paenibacillus sp.]MBR2566766.1 transposase [Paenibacillus sp.]